MAGAAAIAVVSFVASTVVQGKAQKKQARAAAQAAEERKKAGQITQASQENRDRAARRQRIREERVRRSQILEGAGATGAGVSSGAISAGSVLGTSTAGVIAGSLGNAKAREGVSTANQAAATAILGGQQAQARADLFSSGIGLVSNLATKGISSGLFDPAPKIKRGPTPGETGYGTPF